MIDDFSKSGIRNKKSAIEIAQKKIRESEIIQRKIEATSKIAQGKINEIKIAQKKIEEIKAVLGKDHPIFMMNMDEDPPRNLAILEAEIDKSSDAEKPITIQRFIEYFDALIIIHPQSSPSIEKRQKTKKS